MAERLASNVRWYSFTAAGEDFSVYAFSGTEAVSIPYAFMIEVVSKLETLDATQFIGQPGPLTIRNKHGDERIVHGIINAMGQLHTANSFTHYTLTLVPRLSFLDKIQDHRIFQNLTVKDIITTILIEQGFTEKAFAFKLSKTYAPREYCVQYGETNLHFLSRLCEEEGIFFYFEHSKDGHTLCFCDHEGGPKIAGSSDIRFFHGAGQTPDSAIIAKAQVSVAIRSNVASYTEWNFQKTKLDLFSTKSQGSPLPAAMTLEQYRYPHLYQLQTEGNRYADLQLARQQALAKTLSCESNCVHFLPTYTFSINSHPRDDINAGWWILSVTHEGQQPGVLEHEAPDRPTIYSAKVTALPDSTRFVPPLAHPKNLIFGEQTAIVTGPEGEEIFTDMYGRVKVHFHWDRLGKHDETSSCWIRVSQGWAGDRYGIMAVPRIGHEVWVTFLEGNPDRPLITGRTYNAANRPPPPLPDSKTQTIFRSESTPGGEGFIELRIEDAAGKEEIYVHAEKDVNIHVKNDWKEDIHHDQTRNVINDVFIETLGETHETIQGDRRTELSASDNLTVHGDIHKKVEGKWLTAIDGSLHYYAGEKVVLDAGSQTTLRGGGAWLKLTAGGINSPGISAGRGDNPPGSIRAAPMLPEEALDPEISENPEFKAETQPAPVFEPCIDKAVKNESPVCGSYPKE